MTTVEERPELVVSYSSLTKHRKCPQAFNYRYVQGLARETAGAGFPVYFHLGSWWHALRAADNIEKGRREETLIYCPKSLKTPEGIDDIPTGGEKDRLPEFWPLVQEWWSRMGSEYRDTWLGRYGVDSETMLRGMNDRWHDAHAEVVAVEQVLAVEIPFEVPLAHSGARLQGTIDAVLRDKRGMVKVEDYKTAGDVIENSISDIMDSQTHLYVWGMRGWAQEHGLKITAIEYDRIRTAHPKTPVLTASGALSKSVTAYDLNTYLEWCKDGIQWGTEGEYVKTGKNMGKPKFGTYEPEEKEIARLSAPSEKAKWASRSAVPLNKNIIAAQLQAAVDTQFAMAGTMDRIRKSGSAPRNLVRHDCKMCDFQQLCYAEMIGGPGDYDPSMFGLVSGARTDLVDNPDVV